MRNHTQPEWGLWRARCIERCPPGSGSGPEKRICRKADTALRADFHRPPAQEVVAFIDANRDDRVGELVGDCAGVGHRPRQTVKLGHHQPACHVRGRQRAPHGGRGVHGWCRSDRGRRRSAGLDTEAEQPVALSCQVLLVGRTSGVPDKECAHHAPPGKMRSGQAAGVADSNIGQHPTPPASASRQAIATTQRVQNCAA